LRRRRDVGLFVDVRSVLGFIECRTFPVPISGRMLSLRTTNANDIAMIRAAGGPKLWSVPDSLGFGFGFPQSPLLVALTPHWFFAAFVGLSAVALKPSPRYRFSLRYFLALTTFAAMLAALVAWLARLRV
jgi:hypothetical protein